MIAFSDIEEPLKNMLTEFGPFRQSYHPEYPFWRLQSDGIWELENAGHLYRLSPMDHKVIEL